MSSKVEFPISVRFEDGTVETFEDVDALETDLEVFDSAQATDCEVTDCRGRLVRVKVNMNLVLEKLELI